jgi:beta-glucosidase
MSHQFPEGSLWGAATSAHQHEGDNLNSDAWVLERVPSTVFAEPSRAAADHYHRYVEDIELLAGLGLNAFRFTVEWARLEPEPGEFSLAVFDHYRRVLEACRANGIKTAVTYHHFTSPRWLATSGGWSSDETPKRFADFCLKVTEQLGDLIDLAGTINEPNLPALFAGAG